MNTKLSEDELQLRDAYAKTREKYGRAAKLHSFEHLKRRCDELTYGLDIRNGSVLDVGAGAGFFSAYAANCLGVEHVTALDEWEGHGSVSVNHDIILELKELLNRKDVLDVAKFRLSDFETKKKFSHVFMVNTFHHIVETTMSLYEDSESMLSAERELRHVREMMSDQGLLVIQEMSSLNLCPIPKYRKAMSGIDHSSKHSPDEWMEAMRRAGFSKIEVRYRLPINLPENGLLRLVFNNRLASLLTDSSYILTARSA